MWNLVPQPGIKPGPRALGRHVATGPLGKPQVCGLSLLCPCSGHRDAASHKAQPKKRKTWASGIHFFQNEVFQEKLTVFVASDKLQTAA